MAAHALLVSDGGEKTTLEWKRDPDCSAQQLYLFLDEPKPPAPFAPNQFHRDWVSFRAATMAGFVATYDALAHEARPQDPLDVYIYSGYKGNPRGCKIDARAFLCCKGVAKCIPVSNRPAQFAQLRGWLGRLLLSRLGAVCQGRA